MTMLKSFDLQGKKLSFADWISNLSPTETPFISMIPKEKVDQTQYQWQTDRLSQPGKQPNGNKQSADDATTADKDLGEITEGSAVIGNATGINNMLVTKVHSNFTQIYRKAVRVTDTTKKISLYGRSSELTYQMEKAGLEIKRDLEHALLNSMETGRHGAADKHGITAGVQRLVAALGAKDPDTGAVVHQVYNHAANAAPFTKQAVFKLTLDLYLVGARCNKIMFHPMHMAIFSDWIGKTGAPHVHRMFDGMDDKLNAFVKRFRDPLGQEFTLIPNRHMPKNQLFFFNEGDWTQMVLREPEKVLLAKMGSSEKHMIEMEVGLRHRNPFASGILEFNQTSKNVVRDLKTTPSNTTAGNTADDESTVTAIVVKGDGAVGTATETVSFDISYTNDDGSTTTATNVASVAPTVDATEGSPTKGLAVVSTKVKHTKAGRVKVKATVKDNDASGGVSEAIIDTYVPRP